MMRDESASPGFRPRLGTVGNPPTGSIATHGPPQPGGRLPSANERY